MQHLQPNTTLQGGKYRIEKHLASGGFGNTYAAVNTEFDEKVAIKEFFMKDSMERDESTSAVSVSRPDCFATFAEQKKKFKKEARLLRKFHNDHIIRVHDLFEENGTAYYVMDFIDGEDLSKRMKRTGKPLTEKEVMTILPQVLDALKCVHDTGLWHLDLKPSNIMIDGTGLVRLIDFGASKQLNVQTGGAYATSNVASTDRYAPLEQVEKSYDKMGAWTDIYSLGATLYSLLTNCPPPSSSDINDDTTQDKSEVFSKLSTVSNKLRNLVVWMMNPNRKQRPQSIEEVTKYVTLNLRNANPSNGQAISEKKSSHTENDTRTTSEQTISEETIAYTKSKDTKEKVKESLQEEYNKHYNVTGGQEKKENTYQNQDTKDDESNSNFLVIMITISIIIVTVLAIIKCSESSENNNSTEPTTSTTTDDTASPQNGYGTISFYYPSIGEGTYVGELKDGEPEGQGTLTYNNGYKFVGNFHFDGTAPYPETHGHGTFYDPSGKVLFDGEYKSGYRASGTQTFANGSKFTGTYDEYGYPQQGKLTSADGVLLFEGTFTGLNCSYWTGKGKYVDGDYSYEGEYKNGEANGHGIQKWNNVSYNKGYKYEGDFRNDARNGYGTMYYKESGWYEGNWVDGERNGEGTYYYNDHTYVTGTWKKGKLIKQTDSGTWSEN